ncbi:hypothetical protein BJ878DRAFT_500574 [Calycina marina]|uniref:Uncharacterized protein n=1 Tax=Calycina marina TaxID=1763456 RepID=A0A9P8CHM8_9HELO|nr:hypothetical protein BJ878DRAFT_500574 [Calycina marina]
MVLELKSMGTLVTSMLVVILMPITSMLVNPMLLSSLPEQQNTIDNHFSTNGLHDPDGSQEALNNILASVLSQTQPLSHIHASTKEMGGNNGFRLLFP